MRGVAIVVALGCLAGGCAARKPGSAQQYFQLASRDLRQGAYNQAVENYRNLLDEYPFSEYSEEAELKTGIAHFKNESCPEATAAFTDFQRRHPTSPHLPLVGYLLGRCAEQQMRPTDRDQSASQNAHAYYQALIQQHPDSPYAELARERLAHCRQTLAEHELGIARFYLHDGNPKAAEIRLIDLVNRFNDTDAAGDALYQLAELYEDQKDSEKAILALAAVTYHHPDHDAARRAQKELQALLGDEAPPPGDPLAALRAETGRNRNLAVAQVARPVQETRQQARRGATGPGTGLGLPTGGGPFGRGSGTSGPYGTRY